MSKKSLSLSMPFVFTTPYSLINENFHYYVDSYTAKTGEHDLIGVFPEKSVDSVVEIRSIG